jgi:hypothetical protein
VIPDSVIGVYFYRVRVGAAHCSGKMHLVRQRAVRGRACRMARDSNRAGRLSRAAGQRRCAMPITCDFRPDAKLAIFVHVGIVPDDEFLSSYRSFLEDPRFDPSFNLLVDLRRTSSTPRSSGALRTLAQFIRGVFRHNAVRPKVAVIAPEDLSFGLARMYEAFSESVLWEFAVFRAADAALAWLGAPEELMDN